MTTDKQLEAEKVLGVMQVQEPSDYHSFKGNKEEGYCEVCSRADWHLSHVPLYRHRSTESE